MDAQPYGLDAALASGFPDFLGQHPRHAADISRPDPTRFFSSILCTQLALFQRFAARDWNEQVVNAAENRLRGMVIHATPTKKDRENRVEVLTRLRSLARSGIRYYSGLDIEPFGSFVSGLYTRTGDLDLSIEGAATRWDPNTRRELCLTVPEMPRYEQQKFLHSMAARLIASGAQSLNKIVHARVPIIKFVDGRTRVECDVAMGSGGAQFKSAFVGLLASFDWRVGAMVRLVKVWARAHGINDSSQGTLNSFALTLLVIFHLQTRSPAILPPLHTLFIDPRTQSPDDHTLRPMAYANVLPDPSVLRRAALSLGAMATAPPETRNGETLLELLSSFFPLVHALVNGWDAEDEALSSVLRRVRVDTWRGTLHFESWGEKYDKAYRFSVEDPFDSTDNCARTIREDPCVQRIRNASFWGAKAFSEMRDLASVDAMLGACFGGTNAAAVVADQELLWRSDGGIVCMPPSPMVPIWLPQSIVNFVRDVLPPATPVRHFPRAPGDGAAALDQLDLSFARLSTTGAELLNAETWKIDDLESDLNLIAGKAGTAGEVEGEESMNEKLPVDEEDFLQAWPHLAHAMNIEHTRLVEVQERREREHLARKQKRREHKEAKKAAKGAGGGSGGGGISAAAPNSRGQPSGGGGGVHSQGQQQRQQQQHQRQQPSNNINNNNNSRGGQRGGLVHPPGLIALPPLAPEQMEMLNGITTNAGNGVNGASDGNSEGKLNKRAPGKKRNRVRRGPKPPGSQNGGNGGGGASAVAASGAAG